LGVNYFPKWGIKTRYTPSSTIYQNFITDIANAAPSLGVSLQGKFEEMKSFRLAVAKYSLAHGIPYKVETSKPEEYKTSCFRGSLCKKVNILIEYRTGVDIR
jgi:hypothetical protein